MRYLFIMLQLLGIIQAQSLLFENYGAAQGLSHHICLAIAQDNDGMMWFGTLDGLNRYDGREFKVYTQQTIAGKKLPSNSINSLYFDTTHNLLWIATGNGACLYVPSGDSLSKLSDHFPFAALLDKITIRKIVSFKKNEYWIITGNNGLLCLNTEAETIASFFTDNVNKTEVTDIVCHDGTIVVSLLHEIFLLQPSKNTYQAKNLHNDYKFPQIRTLASNNHTLWIGTISAGCYTIKNPIERQENIHPSDLIFGGVETFGKGNNMDLWIATRGSGIFKYDGETGKLSSGIHNDFDPTTPASNFGLAVFKDRQGIIWCGLSGGIAKYDPLRHQFRNINRATSLNGSLIDKAVYSMYMCRDGTRFIGTQNKGLMEWTSSNNAFKQYPASATVVKANNVIYDITEDNSGNIWAASCGGLMQLNRKTNKITYYPEKGNQEKLNKMYVLVKLKKADSLLVACDEGLRFFSLRDMRWIDSKDKTQHSSIDDSLKTFKGGRYFYEDDDSNLWFCSGGKGLVRYRYLTNEIEKVGAVSRVARYVGHMLPNGSHFLLATDNGIVVYDYKTNKIVKQVDTRDNDFSNACYSIQKDNNGYFWASTNFGLCKLNPQYDLLQKYNTGNGLSFKEYSTACTINDPDGTLYFGGMGGITAFNPSDLKQDSFSPSPVITSINVGDKLLSGNKNANLLNNLDFDYNQNFITVNFAATNFSNEKNTKFSYRLKGLNDTWSKPSINGIANFTTLPPGKYVLELRAANSDGFWSESIKTLAINIRTAWWQTWWFKVLVITSLVAVLAYAYNRRIKNIRQEATLKNQMAELEIKGLHTQMNPHFIFNSLNSIKEMIWKDDKRNASRYLSKFAQLIRTSLEHSRQAFITVRQCIDHLEQYLEMEKLRFEDFSYAIEVDEKLQAEETRIAPMLVQPLVENAIWHGLRNKDNDRKLTIRFLKKENQVICEVDDNGVGIRHTLQKQTGKLSAHQSLGIINIKERLTILNEKYHMKCSVQIADKSEIQLSGENGTLAVLQLSI